MINHSRTLAHIGTSARETHTLGHFNEAVNAFRVRVRSGGASGGVWGGAVVVAGSVQSSSVQCGFLLMFAAQIWLVASLCVLVDQLGCEQSPNQLSSNHS